MKLKTRIIDKTAMKIIVMQNKMHGEYKKWFKSHHTHTKFRRLKK